MLIHEDQNNNCYPVFKDPINTWNSCGNLISPGKTEIQGHIVREASRGPDRGTQWGAELPDLPGFRPAGAGRS